MGSGSSKPDTIIQEIIKIDECRPPIHDLSLEYTQDASRKFEKCALKAASDMFMEMNKHQSQVTQDAYQMMLNVGQRMHERARADANFCYNIEIFLRSN